MQIKRYGLGLSFVLIVIAVFSGKTWHKQADTTHLATTQAKGPAVILFKGDNSPSCQAIHKLVDQASTRYSNKINFTQLDWSPDNPLIKQYQVRFLPTVVFVDAHDKEVGRIIGESAAVQQKLQQTLAQLDALLEK